VKQDTILEVKITILVQRKFFQRGSPMEWKLLMYGNTRAIQKDSQNCLVNSKRYFSYLKKHCSLIKKGDCKFS
jgi:hypothetical protein